MILHQFKDDQQRCSSICKHTAPLSPFLGLLSFQASVLMGWQPCHLRFSCKHKATLLHNMLQSDSISITSGTLWCVELHCLWTWKSLHCATLRFSRSSLSRSCSLQNASFHQKSPHPAKCIAQSSNILCHRRTNPVDPEVATCFLTNQVSYLHGASSASRKAPHSHEAVEKYYHPVSEQCSAGSPDFSAHRQHLAIDYGFTD